MGDGIEEQTGLIDCKSTMRIMGQRMTRKNKKTIMIKLMMIIDSLKAQTYN